MCAYIKKLFLCYIGILCYFFFSMGFCLPIFFLVSLSVSFSLLFRQLIRSIFCLNFNHLTIVKNTYLYYWGGEGLKTHFLNVGSGQYYSGRNRICVDLRGFVETAVGGADLQLEMAPMICTAIGTDIIPTM